MVTKAQSRATTRYQRDNLATYVIRCHKVNDSDIIGYLGNSENKAGAIKAAIREKMKSDMEKQSNKA